MTFYRVYFRRVFHKGFEVKPSQLNYVDIDTDLFSVALDKFELENPDDLYEALAAEKFQTREPFTQQHAFNFVSYNSIPATANATPPVKQPQLPPEVWNKTKPDPERAIAAVREMCKGGGGGYA